MIKGTSPINYKIGKIIEFNQNNEMLKGNENKIEEERSSQDCPQIILNQESKSNIQFLLRLHFYYKSFKGQFNRHINNIQNQEIGYIINKDLIEKYKEYYNYNELKQLFDSKKIEINSIEELENSLDNLRIILPNKYIEDIIKKDNNPSEKDEFCNSIRKINQIFYPDNCVVLNEKLVNIFINYNGSIQINKNKIKIQYFIHDKKLIIIYNNNIYIGLIDDNCIFKSEKRIHFNTNLELNKILKSRFDNSNDTINQDLKGPRDSDKIMVNDIKNNKNETRLPNNNGRLNIINDRNISKENNSLAALSNRNIFNTNYNYLIMNYDNNEMNKELKNFLSIKEKIKNKMRMPLDSENSDEYYLLNYNWFKKYLELNNVNDTIYEYLVKSVKNNINISNINLQNEMIIIKAISQIDPNIKKKIIIH